MFGGDSLFSKRHIGRFRATNDELLGMHVVARERNGGVQAKALFGVRKDCDAKDALAFFHVVPHTMKKQTKGQRKCCNDLIKSNLRSVFDHLLIDNAIPLSIDLRILILSHEKLVF